MTVKSEARNYDEAAEYCTARGIRSGKTKTTSSAKKNGNIMRRRRTIVMARRGRPRKSRRGISSARREESPIINGNTKRAAIETHDLEAVMKRIIIFRALFHGHGNHNAVRLNAAWRHHELT